MASVWYIGFADVRIITSADWTSVSAPGDLTRWDKTNGWSISQTALTQPQITYLDAHDEFVVTNSDGPRPGSAVTPDVDESVTREDLLELALADLDDVNLTAPSVGRVLAISGINPIMFDAVDAVSAGGADNNSVVHKTGDETIAGVKTFSTAPVVPAGAFPESAISGLAADLAAKLPTSGGALTGPLTLSGAPTQNLHAVTKQYADSLSMGGGGGVILNAQVDFGAVGNDSADDTTALDNAIAAAKAQKRPLYVPPGTYRYYGATGWDLTGDGLVAAGHNRKDTIIKQMVANAPGIRIGGYNQHISDLTIMYGATPAPTDTNANGWQISIATGFSTYERLHAYDCGRGWHEMPNTGYFSSTFTDITVLGFQIDGMNLVGTGGQNTGSVWTNVYIHNNPLGPDRNAFTGHALNIGLSDEMVFNQLNIEWMLASGNDPIGFGDCGNIVINDLHIEQVDLSAWGIGFIGTSAVNSLLINGMTIVFSSVTNNGTHSIVRGYAALRFALHGLYQHDVTIAGTFVLANVTDCTTPSSVIADHIDTSMFTAVSAGEKAAPLQIVRRVNENLIRWKQGGANVTTGLAAPMSGTWTQGDTVWNSAPASGGVPGWICISGGTPGVWSPMPALTVQDDLPNGGPAGVTWNRVFTEDFGEANAATLIASGIWRAGWWGNQDEISGPVNTLETAQYDSTLIVVSGGHGTFPVIPDSGNRSATKDHLGSQINSNPWQTTPGFTMSYGYVECRMQQPAGDETQSLWPGFWMTGNTWPDDMEIDIMEGDGTDAGCSFNIHHGADGVETINLNQINRVRTVTGATTGMHTYAADIRPDGVTFYYDGVSVYDYVGSVPDAQRFIMVGNSLGGTLAVQKDLVVDYIRAWVRA